MTGLCKHSLAVSFCSGVAIVLITGFHVARYMGYDHFGTLSWSWRTGGFDGVRLFFLMSGVKLAMGYRDLSARSFYLSRLLALLPAYYVSMFVWYLIVCSGVAVKPVGWFDLVTHMTLLHGIWSSTFYSWCGAFWFLGILFWLYLLFPVLHKAGCRRGGLPLLWIAVAALAAATFVHGNCESLLFQKLTDAALPVFVIGMFLGRNMEAICAWLERLGWFGGALLLCSFMTLGLEPQGEFLLSLSCHVVKPVVFFLGALACQHFVDIPTQSGCRRRLECFARSTYSIFLYNYIFYLVKPVHRNWLSFMALVLFVLGFGLIVHFLLNDPLTRWIRSRAKT